MRTDQVIGFGLYTIVVGLLCFSITCDAQRLNANRLVVRVVPPVAPGWPTLFAAQYTGTEAPASQIIYTWTFSDGVQSCTARGRTGTNPCRGQVVERAFSAGVTTTTVWLTAGVSGWPNVQTNRTFSIAVTAVPTVTRREVRSMGSTQWNALVAGLHQLKALGIYDHFVYLHQVAGITGTRVGTNRNAAHRGPAFLPWHRAFLRHVERTLQVISGNNGLYIPFWDWTIDQGLSRGPLSSPVWTNAYFGPGGQASDNYIVRSGPFCSRASSTCAGRWPLLTQLAGPNLQRELGRWYNRLPSSAEINRIFSVGQYDGGTYDDRATATSSFRQVLEGWAGGVYGNGHNGVHVFVGGSMSPLSSPNDPVFFFHHCNVDRLWYRWQQQRGCFGSNCYRPVNGVSQSTPGSQLVGSQWRIVGHHWGDTMYPWNVRPADVADTTNSLRGYTYSY